MTPYKTITPADRLASLKSNLVGSVFTQVARIITKPEDMICFQQEGESTQYEYDPFFEENWFKLTAEQRDQAEKSFRFYYGFTTCGTHFTSKGFLDEVSFGIIGGMSNIKFKINPPVRGTWMTGTLYKQNAFGKGPAFCFWSVCPVQYKHFADLLLGRCTFEQRKVDQLIIGEGVNQDLHLMHLALALHYRDLSYFLFARRNGNLEKTDLAVKNIANNYDPSLWVQYVAKAEEQRIYSSLIPAPAPKPIRHVRDASYEQQVGLNTPFTGLAIP